MKITMSAREIDLLSYFLSASNAYFEFGMGGSTCLAASKVRNKVYAVDSDTSWIAKVREEIGRTPIDLTLKHVNVGPTGGWGTPKGTSHSHLFSAYSLAIEETVDPCFDLCLVDGRFRIACFLSALYFLKSDAIIGMHDYTPRPHYHVIEKFARPISRVDTLAFFVRRSDVSLDEIKATADSYRKDPA